MKNIPDDETGKVLIEFARNGIDLSKPIKIDFFVAVPSGKEGDIIANKVLAIGFNTSVEQDEETGEWTCYCTKILIPSYLEIVRIEKQLDELSQPFGGYIDGFGSYGNI
ncbi:MAG: ribonuclease E inhibitor RraB [Planctomycetes bacterium]|nr:ribonuclease E inhibitor RraB [Planctomycetota bacterium]